MKRTVIKIKLQDNGKAFGELTLEGSSNEMSRIISDQLAKRNSLATTAIIAVLMLAEKNEDAYSTLEEGMELIAKNRKKTHPIMSNAQKLTIYERLYLAAQHLEMASKELTVPGEFSEEAVQIISLKASVLKLKKAFAK